VAFQLTVNVVALTLNMVCAIAGGEVPLTAVQLFGPRAPDPARAVCTPTWPLLRSAWRV